MLCSSLRFYLRLFCPPTLYFASAAAARDPVRSNPSCSHRLFINHVLRIRTVSLQRSIISRVTMYYATVFCLLSTYASTSSNPASYIAVSKSWYYQIPSNNSRGCLQVICLATLF